MNQLKSVVFVAVRGYHKGFKAAKSVKSVARDPRQRIKNAAEKPEKKFTEKQLYSNIFDEDRGDYADNIDFEDKDNSEADFMKVGKSYSQHRKEENYQKEVLKLRIVKRKYFKSQDPNLLTIADRQQIIALHTQSSVEWSPENLSQSFPALPETIKNILKSKWIPETVHKVMKYDQTVADNWKKLKEGKLPLSLALEDHLKKFKNRKIVVCNNETHAERFVKEKPNFPAPRSTLFSGLVRGYVEKLKSNAEAEKKEKQNENEIRNTSLVVADQNRRSQVDPKYMTFDSYLKAKANRLNNKEELSLSDQVLLEEYKSVQNKASVEGFNQNVKKNSSELVEADQYQVVDANRFEEKQFQPVTLNKINLETSLQTGVIEWVRKPTAEDDYPSYIKVPANKRYTYVTYRIKDRYYDSDGEFLYKTLGLER